MATECSSAWLERYVRDVEVGSSNLLTPTILLVPFLPLGKGFFLEFKSSGKQTRQRRFLITAVKFGHQDN